MKLDRDTCFGGRFNNKDVIGIKYNGYTIFPKTEYNIVLSFKGDYVGPNMYTPSYEPASWLPGYIETDSTDSNGITTREISFSAGIMHSITFYGDTNITNISRLKGCFRKYDFRDLKALESINLSETDTSSVTNMLSMFAYCESLTTLDLSGFDTSKVTNMNYMFNGCYKLEELNLSNWDAGNIEEYWENGYQHSYMDCFLSDCYKLHTLRLNNCSNDTIRKIINSYFFPTEALYDSEGNLIPRKIYCREANAAGLTPPKGWEFVFIPDVLYDEPTEALLVTESMTQEAEERLTISQATYDPDNENLNI